MSTTCPHHRSLEPCRGAIDDYFTRAGLAALVPVERLHGRLDAEAARGTCRTALHEQLLRKGGRGTHPTAHERSWLIKYWTRDRRKWARKLSARPDRRWAVSRRLTGKCGAVCARLQGCVRLGLGGFWSTSCHVMTCVMSDVSSVGGERGREGSARR